MKKLLIIQQDDPYFLYETLRVLEKSSRALDGFELTLLCSEASRKVLFLDYTPLIKGLTSDVQSVLTNTYDISINLSLNEESWDLHGKILSPRKSGPYLKNGLLKVHDLWSTFYLTIKADAPFLPFHAQDIFRNILGIKRIISPNFAKTPVRTIILGHFNPNYFSNNEEGHLKDLLKKSHPHLDIKSAHEVDLVSDLTHAIYVGPASIEGIKICDAGASGLIFASTFQGPNLFPYYGNHHLLSTKGQKLRAHQVIGPVSCLIAGKSLKEFGKFSIYKVDHDNLFGAYLKSLNRCDDIYPFYQSHVVLWNFLLSLFDVNLDITQCSPRQLELIKSYQNILTKLLKLHDYVMTFIDQAYHEVKHSHANGDKINQLFQQIAEVEEIMDKMAQGHIIFRPVLDFYKIRKGQNEGHTLHEQIKDAFLTTTEEHHALMALSELFSVTLNQNELNP